MAIGVGRKRDDRRRRVLRDERTGDEEVADGARRRGSRRLRLRYGAAARRRHQPAIVDLLPLSGRSFWLSVFGLSLVVSGVLAAFWNMAPSQVVETQASQLLYPALLDNPFGVMTRLTAWLASSLFIASALVAFQIFLVRRHRRDDYRGHYSLWLWTTAFLLLASADAATGAIDQAARLGLSQAAPTWNASWLIAGLRTLVIAAVVGRLAWEMSEHRASMSALICTGLLGCSLEFAPLLMTWGVTPLVVVASEGLLVASASLVATLWHARFVVIDAAQGGGVLGATDEASQGEAESEAKTAPAKRKSRTVSSEDESDEDEEEAEKPTRSRKPAGRSESTTAREVEPAKTESPKPDAAKVAAKTSAGAQVSAAATSSSTPVLPAAAAKPEPPASARPAAAILPNLATRPEPEAADDDEDEGEGDEDDGSMAGMSKAQRKKLAKMQRRAARRGAA